MKVLCAEPIEYYTSILDDEFIHQNEMTYDGMRRASDLDYIKGFDLIVTIQYLWGLCNLLVINAKKNGIKTMLLTDGIVEWNNCFYHPAVLKEQDVLFSKNIHDFVLTPSSIVTNLISPGFSGISYTPKKIKPKIVRKCSKKFDFLITTANSAYFCHDEFKYLSILLVDIILTAISSGYSVALRVFDKKILAELEAFNIPNIIECDFDKFMSFGDVIISTPSSVVLTSMISGKRTCQIIYRNSPILLQSGWMIHHATDIKITLNSLLSNTCDEQSRINFQNKIVQDNNNFSLSDSIELLKSKNVFSNENENENENDKLLKLLNSPFNFNIEWTLRRIVKWIRNYL